MVDADRFAIGEWLTAQLTGKAITLGVGTYLGAVEPVGTVVASCVARASLCVSACLVGALAIGATTNASAVVDEP